MKNDLSERMTALPASAYRQGVTDICSPIAAKVLWMYPQRMSGARFKRASVLHSHTFWEIHVGVCGSAIYSDCDNRFFEIKAGKLVCFPPGVAHCLHSCTEDACRISLTLSMDASITLAEEARVVEAEWLDAWVRLCLTAWEKNGVVTPYLLEHAISSLLLLLPLDHTSIPPLPKGEDARLTRAKRYVLDHADQNVKVSDVAAEVHLSVRQLERIFYAAEGISIAEMIDRARLNRARELLSDPVLTVLEVSERLSFSNEYNFIRFFKRLEGVTPGKYRTSRERF